MAKKTSKVILMLGASAGIGSFCATYFNSMGHIVLGMDRRSVDTPPPIQIYNANMVVASSVRKAIQSIIHEYGKIDIVINVLEDPILFEPEGKPANLRKEWVETQFLGVVEVCKAVLPHMQEQQCGRIIHVSALDDQSCLGSDISLYHSIRFSLEGISQALNNEFAHLNFFSSVLECNKLPFVDFIRQLVGIVRTSDIHAKEYRDLFFPETASSDKSLNLSSLLDSMLKTPSRKKPVGLNHFFSDN